MKPLVSIIIVNWNGGDVFKECLKSLSKITYPNWELIVVDNGSSDDSVELVEEYSQKFASAAKKTLKKDGGSAAQIRENSHKQLRVEIIENKVNKGFAQANNQGYEKAKGEYILLLNNDTKVTPDFLDKLVERMEDEDDLGVVQPKIYMMGKNGHLDNAGSFMTRIGFLSHWGFGEKDGKEFEKEREIFSAKGACMLIRREVIEKVGLFDKDFHSYFEESDFCWRVWLAGYSVLFYPKATIEHKVGFTINRLDVGNLNYHYYKNRITSLLKNLGTANLLTILPLHIFVSLGIAFAFLVRGRPKNSMMIANAILWNAANVEKTLAKRSKIQILRKVGDRKLFRKLMHKIDWKKFYGDFKRVEKDINS